jgi:hypothetical protein
MVKPKKILATLAANPIASKAPPKNSVAAAINPHTTGNIVIPKNFIAEPTLSQASTPPEILGYPWYINMIPIPTRRINNPKS